jgi:hypothetical protein
MLLLVLAVEAVLSPKLPSLTPPMAFDWQHTGRASRHEATRSQILVLGDSQLKYGLAPSVIESRLGRSCYNLALGQGQAPSTYFLLRRVLEAGARPDAILVDFKPLLFHEDYLVSEPRWAELLEWKECLELAWTCKDARFFATTVSSRYLGSLRRRHEIRRWLVTLLSGTATSDPPATVFYHRNQTLNRGAWILAKTPRAANEVRRDDPGWEPPAWKPDRVNFIYMRRLLSLAHKHRISLFWLLPPNNPDWIVGQSFMGDHSRYIRLVRSEVARFPNSVVLDGLRLGYDPSVFADVTHLDADGATRLSLDVATALANKLRGHGGSEKWVTLRSQPAPPELQRPEDLFASELAVRFHNGSMIR